MAALEQPTSERTNFTSNRKIETVYSERRMNVTPAAKMDPSNGLAM